MDERRLTFLPFPFVFEGERRDGLTHAWPSKCVGCRRRECESSNSTDLEICWQGYNYLKVDDSVLIAGVVAKDFPITSPRRSKALATVRADAISSARIREVATRARMLEEESNAEADQAKQAILDDYRESQSYKSDIVELLQPSLQQAFAQVHDYRQLITQIIQNINVVLNQTTPDQSLDSQLDAASKPIKSIYWAARLMEFKLESALFLVHPERIHDHSKRRSFRFHGAVLKYLSIYEPQMTSRQIVHQINGVSFGNIVGNPDALGVIPHAFIDNAVKYAPDRSEIVLAFAEDSDSISFSVGSLGPRIRPEERGHVFDLFFRGSAAQNSTENGTGFGLGLAQHIAGETGCVLSVTQESKSSRADYYWTTFAAKFAKGGGPEANPDRSLQRARVRTRGGGSSIR